MANTRNQFNEAIHDLINTSVRRALAEVQNNGPLLDNARTVPYIGQPAANGEEDENGAWVTWWGVSDEIGSAPVKPF